MSELLLQHFDLLATAPGGVARLRELILTLAVQGKLVPQDPSDEPASMLLQRIRAEKDRLIAVGKIKRDKPLPPITDEEKLFELPVGWEWVRLADIVRVLNGRAYSKQELLEAGPTPVLRVGNLFTSNHWYYSNLALEPDKYCVEGDLLYAWSASFGPFIWGGPKAIYHYHIWKLEPWSAQYFDAGYFHKFLYEKTAEIKASGHGVSMIHMTKEKMEKIVVSLPPLEEQSRIVARVEELMHLCDALEAKGQLDATQHAQLLHTLLGTLTDSATPEELAASWQRVAAHFDLLLDRPEAVDALEQTILQLAVRGLLVPQDPNDEPASVLLQRIRAEKDRLIAEGKIKRDKPLPPITDEEKPFELPEGWELVRMGDLIELISGQHLGPNEYVEGLGAGLPYLTGPAEFGLVSPEPSRSTNERRAIAIHADILITVKGSGVGKLNVVAHREIAISRQLMAIRPVQMDSEYLMVVLQTMALHFQEKSVGIAIPGIGREDVTNTLIGLPPTAEQSRIVARVEELRQLCADLHQRLTASRTTQVHLAEALVED